MKGPTAVDNPLHTYMCDGCEYLISRKLQDYGAPKDHIVWYCKEPYKASHGWAAIGKYTITPTWCPFWPSAA